MKNRMTSYETRREGRCGRPAFQLGIRFALEAGDASCRNNEFGQWQRSRRGASSTPGGPSSSARRSCSKSFPLQSSPFIFLQKGDRMDHLTKSRLGRVVLHALCLLRRPANARWHWLGIVREFAH